MKNTKIFQDISLLYELSLSVGNSLDIKQNCEQFLNILIIRKNLNFASIWIKNDDHLNLTYGTPLNIIADQTINLNHYIWEKLQSKNKFLITADHPSFKKCVQEKNISIGAFAIFKLADIGFLKLYKSDIKGNEIREVNQLVNVINKFSLLLTGCIAHEKLKEQI